MDGSDEEMKFWQFLDDLEPFLEGDPEVPQEEVWQDWGKYSEEELCQGEASSSQEPSDWEEHVGQGLCLGDVIICEELSDWEEHIGQNVFGGDDSRASGHSSWEGDSDKELVQICEDNIDHSTWSKPLAPEDEWDEVSVLELPPEEEKDQKWRDFVAGGLPVPREAWVECPALEPSSQGPEPGQPRPGQSPEPVQRGALALGAQPAAPSKRPSRFRRGLRALRGLFRCPCLRAQTESTTEEKVMEIKAKKKKMKMKKRTMNTK